MKQNNSSFLAIVTVFFFWGFLAASNGIFIPFCKSHFSLSQFQSQLVDSSFYGAYFIGSLLLYIFSLESKQDVINKWGYKKTIIYGLLISVSGAALMIPAVNSGSFAFILGAFFIIALGFALQQTSANPLVVNLGNPAKGSHRLNFAGSINSFGTTIGPILVSLILFGKAIADDSDKQGASVSSISVLYVILCVAFGLAALILHFASIPKLEIENNETQTKILKQPLQMLKGFLFFLTLIFIVFSLKSINENSSQFIFLLSIALALAFVWFILQRKTKILFSNNAFETKNYPQINWGMFAIFVYVGVEVTIQSNLGALLKLPEYGSWRDSEIGPFISLYWGSLMIGRWTGSLGAFNLKSGIKNILLLVVPFAAFSLVLFMNHLSGKNISDLYMYFVCVLILIIAFFIAKEKPATTLILFSSLAAIAMLIGCVTTGMVSVYAYLSGGLFCSVMWPCIFSLSTAGLGAYTSQGSAFLIMMILGGAFIPPLQGFIADKINIHFSYIITIFCFSFLALFGIRVKSILKNSGIDFDSKSESNTH